MKRLTAETIAVALRGRRLGKGWRVRCPAHADKTPSLCVADGVNGKTLVFCHAGCTQSEVIAALKQLGLWGTCGTNKR